MRMCLLFTDNLKELPKTINVVRNWGSTLVVYDDGRNCACGDHLMIEGDEMVIRNWLFDCGDVWVTNGSPILEQFNLTTFTRE
jgi:hypothetical protein